MANTGKKYPSHLTVRLNQEEWCILDRDAGDVPYSVYVRRLIRCGTRQADEQELRTTEDNLRLALHLLGKAAQTREFDGLAKAAQAGTLILPDEQYQMIAAACADTRLIRNDILKYLKFRKIYE